MKIYIKIIEKYETDHLDMIIFSFMYMYAKSIYEEPRFALNL